LDDEKLHYVLIAPNNRKNVNTITIKELQVTLKNALKKIEVLDFNSKLGSDCFDEDGITRFQSNCKNPKLRNIYFTLIHNDFFTHVRMKKYKMTETDECPICGLTETTKHLLWECEHNKQIWSLFNALMNQVGNYRECVKKYEEVFQTCQLPGICTVKMKIIQEMIQVEKTVNWNGEKPEMIIREIIKIEKYNATVTRTIVKFKIKWNSIEKILSLNYHFRFFQNLTK
jgi:hypothetical protein